MRLALTAKFRVIPPGRSRPALWLRVRRVSAQGVEHRAGGAQIRRLESFGELVVDRRENLSRPIRPILGQPQASEAERALAALGPNAAPWWRAKAIRVLEQAGAASAARSADARAIEERLGLERPQS